MDLYIYLIYYIKLVSKQLKVDVPVKNNPPKNDEYKHDCLVERRENRKSRSGASELRHHRASNKAPCAGGGKAEKVQLVVVVVVVFNISY